MEVTIDGHTVLIDEEDTHFLEEYRWVVRLFGYRKAFRVISEHVFIDGKDTGVRMLCRLILGNPDGCVKHINSDHLDLRRSNLTIVPNGPSVVCPFSAEQLRDMYETHLMSVQEIASQADVLLGRSKPMAPTTPRTWLKQHGIPVRNYLEAGQAARKKKLKYTQPDTTQDTWVTFNIHGYEVKIDTEDAHLITEYNWRVVGSNPNKRLKVTTSRTVDGKTRLVVLYLHKEVCGTTECVKAANGNLLDLRRNNLLIQENGRLARQGCPFSHDELRDLYINQQLALDQIRMLCGQRFNRQPVHNGTVNQWLRAANIPRRRCGHDKIPCPLSREQLYRMYVEEGMSCNAIAALRNLTGPVARRWLSEHDIPLRARSEAMRVAKRFPSPVERKREIATSKPERDILDWLERQGEKVETQHRIHGVPFVYDFYLPETNTLLEFNGDYWHCNPSIYGPEFDIPFQHRGRITAEAVWDRDDNKRFAAEQAGYRFKTLWEKDFKERGFAALEELLAQP